MRAFQHALLLLLSLANASVYAEERITRFHSDIQILADRSLSVTETIEVMVENRAIRHGIYREFPTIYPHPSLGALGFREKTGFDLRTAELDGEAVPWHQERLSNGVRTYIGDASRLVAPGVRSYRLQYHSTRQIGRLGGDDILHWNVNGQDWVFPTESVSATVRLPGAGQFEQVAAWTGAQDEMGADYEIETHSNGEITIRGTREFNPGEGLTILLQLPAGSVAEPGGGLSRLLSDNWLLLLGLGLLAAMPLYYYRAWQAVGRDPEKGVVVADYHPVRNLSPAAHRYITLNRSDDTTLSAALVNIGIKGQLRIEQTGKKSFLLHNTRDPGDPDQQPLTPIEDVVHRALFKESDQLLMGREYNAAVANAKKHLDKLLRAEWRDTIYRDNRRYSWYGLAIGIAALLLCALHFGIDARSLGWLMPVGVFAFLAIGLSQRQFRWITLVPVALFGFNSVVLTELDLFRHSGLLVFALFVVGLFILFHYLLKAPTPFGQKILDEIEGFRLYLATAEQHRLNILHPPEKTPELFESLLPYAIALGVENQWSDQFSELLKRNAQQREGYQPGWYSGDYKRGFSSAGMASSLGAGLSGSVAAAATAPSSSSGGFSGGGGAGGGGGGGGGGGW